MTEATPITKKINYTPRAKARYCYLINAREQLDKSKPWAYSCQLTFAANDPKALQILKMLEQAMDDCHGRTKARAEKGMPMRLDGSDPSLYVMRFKALRFTNRDNSFSPGPIMCDAARQPWNGQEVGNGSELIVAYKIRPYDGKEGVGLTLIPTAIQVVSFVPYIPEDGADGFEEQPGGYTVPGFAEEFDEFDEEAPF